MHCDPESRIFWGSKVAKMTGVNKTVFAYQNQSCCPSTCQYISLKLFPLVLCFTIHTSKETGREMVTRKSDFLLYISCRWNLVTDHMSYIPVPNSDLSNTYSWSPTKCPAGYMICIQEQMCCVIRTKENSRHLEFYSCLYYLSYNPCKSPDHSQPL